MRGIIKIVVCTGLLIFSIFLMQAQKDDKPLTIQQLIDQEVKKQVMDYRMIRLKRCREKILEAAGRQADSIVIARAKELKMIQDTVARPLPPGRPSRPDLLQPIDSSAPAPILRKDTSEIPGQY